MKHLFLPFMFFALATMGCSTNEPSAGSTADAAVEDLFAINPYTYTSRAADTTTNSLEYDGEVVIHIDDGSIHSTYRFAYSEDGEWEQDGTSLSWSDISYPVSFYSMHDSETAFSTLSFDGSSAKFADYTVEGESVDHKDLVYHASTLNATPVGSTLNLYHRHALSKLHLYAATGTTKLYVARATLVNIDGEGSLTITPLTADAESINEGVDWVNSGTADKSYLYHYIDTEAAEAIYVDNDGNNPLINDTNTAPMMIIPQTTEEAEAGATTDSVIAFSGSYVEVIYYMTDSEDIPLVGYSQVSKMPNATDYIDSNQTLTLYVMGAFPLGKTFEANTEYDITLGLGVSGSTGGLLIKDYYVNQDGGAVLLTTVADADDGTDEDDDSASLDIEELEAGDPILGDGTFSILVSANDWLEE